MLIVELWEQGNLTIKLDDCCTGFKQSHYFIWKSDCITITQIVYGKHPSVYRSTSWFNFDK